MNTCGSYGDDLTLEYRVPIRTNVNVQAGAIQSRNNTSNCNGCSYPYTNGYSNMGSYGTNNMNYSKMGVGGYSSYTNGYSSNGYTNGNTNGYSNGYSSYNNNPTCLVETRGRTKYRTCYYRDGTTTIETFNY